MSIQHNYSEQDVLMNIETGSIDTVENWIAESSEWFTDEVPAQKQFDELQLVSR